MKPHSKSNSKSSNKKQLQSNNSWKGQKSSSSENSWGKTKSNGFQSNSNFKSASDSLWNDPQEHFPALGAAATVPANNVWEKRKSKFEEIKSLQPRNEYDEEAMFQQALALSLLETSKEKERKRIEEEKFLLQLQEVEFKKTEDDLDYFNAPNDFIACSTSESPCAIRQAEELSYDKVSGNKNVSDAGSKEFHSQTSGGARPKLNKIIDSFGGWGLKEGKKKPHSDKLSEFVNEVIDDRSLKNASNHGGTVLSYQRDSKNRNDKDKVKIKIIDSEQNLWLLPDEKAVERTSDVSSAWESKDILYNGQETFVETEDIDLKNFNDTQRNEVPKVSKDISPNKALDHWLHSEDVNDWENDGNKADFGTKNDEAKFVDTASSVPLNCSKSEVSKDEYLPNSANTYLSNFSGNFKTEKLTSETYHKLDLSSKPTESDESSWLNNNQENKLLHSSSHTHKNNGCDSNSNEKQSFESDPALHLNNSNIWTNQTSSSYLNFSSFPDAHGMPKTATASDVIPDKMYSKVDYEIVNNMPNDKTEQPPILPPQPAPIGTKLSEGNVPLTNETLNAIIEEESPCVHTPQPVSEIQPPPQLLNNSLFNPPGLNPLLPGLNPLLPGLNPLLPGLNPMLAYGMDPVAMRQMLMLNNSYFARQLLAMEQYYQSLGMPVDLFSFSSMPNAVGPGMMPLGQNSLTNPAFSHAGLLNLQYQNPLNNVPIVPMPQSNNNFSNLNFPATPAQPSELGANVLSTDTPQNDSDSWYKSFLTSDSPEIIPPPKPPTCNDADYHALSAPKPVSRSNQSASCVGESDVYIPSTSISPASNIHQEKREPFTAIESCITKTEITGWGDLEDEAVSSLKPKTTCGWDDEDIVPSIKAPSVNRQPARQPQFNRFPKNRTYN